MNKKQQTYRLSTDTIHELDYVARRQYRSLAETIAYLVHQAYLKEKNAERFGQKEGSKS